MKTVEEILRPFIAQPYIETEGHFAVNNHNATSNTLKIAGLNQDYIIRAIKTCNPELLKEENSALLGEVIARLEQEMQPSVCKYENLKNL